ncbi:MAG: hypothetical protein ACOXZV_01970 [Bacteroidales bacterium]|jgi:hypothetical protein
MKIYKIKFSPEIIFYLFIRQKLCFLNEVMGGLFHDPHGGVLNKEKALSASCVGCHLLRRLPGFFISSPDIQTDV